MINCAADDFEIQFSDESTKADHRLLLARTSQSRKESSEAKKRSRKTPASFWYVRWDYRPQIALIA